MHECVLTAGVYFDLFDVLKNKDCQFSCTDANMSMDSGGTESRVIFFRDSHGMWWWYWWGIANKVWHGIPYEAPRKHWHSTCFEIKKKSCRFKVASFSSTFFKCLPCIYFLFPIADSVLGNFCRCSVDPGHLFFSLFLPWQLFQQCRTFT